MASKSDDNLYKQLIEGSESALEEVYKKYKPEFMNFFKSYEISQNHVLDIYQDSIIVLFQKFFHEKFRLEKSSLKTYLFGIGKNKVYSHFKNKRHKISDIEQLRLSTKEFEIENEPNIYEKSLAKNLKLMSKSCSSILELFYFRNLTIKEIVRTTDYKDENTVKSHKSRCLKKLKALCQNESNG